MNETTDYTRFNPQRHYGCRINDQVIWAGYRALILQNELLQIVVLLDKGAEIVQFLYKPQDVDFLWHSEKRLRDPRLFVPTGGTQISPFFDRWSGGWFEVLPNGGTACTYKGADLGFFAETINLPCDYRILEDTPEKVCVAMWVHTYRTPFLLHKTLTLVSGKPHLYIQEKVTNTGREEMDFMWGHHPVVGAPFLDENCLLFAPPCKVEIFHDEDGPDYRMGLFQEGEWPIIKDRHGNPLDLRIIPPPTGKTMDNCYLKDFKEGWIAVNNPTQGVGFGLVWDPAVFRYIWIWQALGGGIGYPWFGRTYNLGIEPWTSYPCAGLVEAVNRGTDLRLASSASLDAWLTAIVFTDKEVVNGINENGDIL